MNRISRIIFVAALALAPFAAFAQAPAEQPAGPVTVGQPIAPPTQPVATQNTITTTGPVSSTTKIETGTLAGQALLWIATIFSVPIGSLLTRLLLQLAKNAGFAGADLLRSKLQEIIVNGLNAGAKEAADKLQGKGKIEVKNDIVAHAVVYAQDHGAETLKALGLDPTSPQAVEAIKARIETAIADPATPTPAVLDPGKQQAPTG